MAVTFTLKMGTTSGNVATVPSPTSYDIEYEDQSASDAGRVESGKMYKKRLGTIRKASFSWQNLSDADAQRVFAALQNEYVYAQILDPFKKTSVTTEFYAGNRKASYRAENNGTWTNISCSLTERSFASL